MAVNYKELIKKAPILKSVLFILLTSSCYFGTPSQPHSSEPPEEENSAAAPSAEESLPAQDPQQPEDAHPAVKDFVIELPRTSPPPNLEPPHILNLSEQEIENLTLLSHQPEPPPAEDPAQLPLTDPERPSTVTNDDRGSVVLPQDERHSAEEPASEPAPPKKEEEEKEEPLPKEETGLEKEPALPLSNDAALEDKAASPAADSPPDKTIQPSAAPDESAPGDLEEQDEEAG